MILALLLAAMVADPPAYALRNVHLFDRVDAPEVTLILRAGLIEGTLDARSEIPPGTRVIDGKGWLAMPAFIDAYTQAGCRTPEPEPDQDLAPPPTSDVMVDMRDANRKGVQAGFRCADAMELDEKTGKSYREQGFGLMLSAPAGQILSGTSAFVATRDAALRDVVLEPVVFQHAAFRATGSGYPSTLMGYAAQLRQVLLDARHQDLLARRRVAGSRGPRPPYDPGLEALMPLLRGEQRVLCEAETARDIERWIALADEFGLSIAIAGGREAWKLAALLAERKIPVFLTLEWEDEVADPGADEAATERKPDAERAARQEGAAGPPEDEESVPVAATEDLWRYEEPRGVRLERRRRWEEGRDCVLRLIDAGVEVCLGSGTRTPKELLDKVRALVRVGLPVETALKILTELPARQLGFETNLGRIEVGYDAMLAIWTANPFVGDAHIAWLFVEGYPYEFDVELKLEQQKPARGVDATGTWVFEFEDEAAQPATAELEMYADGRVRGTIEYVNPGEARRMIGRFEGRVSGDALELRGKVRIGMFETEVDVKGRIEGDKMTGDMVWKWSGGADTTAFTARREPKGGR